ncbi:MAG TPA: M20/M25/M40 family metallo-hydrolase [Longimicrobiales bacterium]|nr:M20/M25/M40 family metallo-hydrolase [Longimicrobiales bacterium]
MRKTCRAPLVAGLVLALAAPLAAQVAQERVDLSVVARIRDEGLNRSQVPELAGYLTDVIGPRLTNSPGMKRANEWTAATFRDWGLRNVVIEPWGEFGRGWENLSISFRALDPYAQPLEAWPVGWSGSTPGTVTGEAVLIEAEEPADVARYAGRLRGAFVLLQPHRGIPPEYEPRDRRHSLEWLLEPPVAREDAPPADRDRQMAEWQRQRAVREAIAELVAGEEVAALLQPSGWTYGIIRLGGTGAWRKDTPVGPPELVLSHEDYGQIWRNVKRGIPVRLELDVRNRFHEDDLQGYNTLADLPGSDLAGQLVMIGGHLDSWHSGTGATDNAAGSVVMMEAMRILKSLGVPPRRTIRIALWSGEEQGLWGSRKWVENHPELHERISAYLNVDNGTGRLRGIWDQSNAAAIPIFEQILWPFRDLGVVAVKHGNTGGTDHLSFDRAGIPGFNFIQDPIEYSIRTHHSNVDTFERLVLEDLMQAAVVVAATAWHLANRDEMMPRKAPAPAATSSR